MRAHQSQKVSWARQPPSCVTVTKVVKVTPALTLNKYWGPWWPHRYCSMYVPCTRPGLAWALVVPQVLLAAGGGCCATSSYDGDTEARGQEVAGGRTGTQACYCLALWPQGAHSTSLSSVPPFLKWAWLAVPQ